MRLFIIIDLKLLQGREKTFFTYFLEAEIRHVFRVFYRRLGAAATGVGAPGPGHGVAVGGGLRAGVLRRDLKAGNY